MPSTTVPHDAASGVLPGGRGLALWRCRRREGVPEVSAVSVLLAERPLRHGVPPWSEVSAVVALIAERMLRTWPRRRSGRWSVDISRWPTRYISHI